MVVIAGGNEGARIDRGIALVAAGFAPLLVTDDSGIRDGRRCRTSVPTVCFAPTPNTTRGEARAVAAMAAARGWHSVLLVLSKDQATRARIRFRRCYHRGLSVVAVPIGPELASQTAYQDAAMVKAEVFERGC